MDINESLKRFRTEFRLTQDDVAKVLGTSKQSYYRYEKDVIPSAEVIKKIALAFCVSTDYLLGLTDLPNNNPNAEIMAAVSQCYQTVFKICGGGRPIAGIAPPAPPLVED